MGNYQLSVRKYQNLLLVAEEVCRKYGTTILGVQDQEEDIRSLILKEVHWKILLLIMSANQGEDPDDISSQTPIATM